MLKLMDLTHMISDDAARAVVNAMMDRQPPGSEVVDDVIAHHEKAKMGYSASWSYGDLLGKLAENGSSKALDYLRSAWKKAEGKERVDLFAEILRGVPPSEALDLCVQCLQDNSEDHQAVLPVAARGLIRSGATMREVSLVMPYVDLDGDAAHAGFGKLAHGEMQTVVMEVVPQLSKRAKFRTVDDLKSWWERVRGPLDNASSLANQVSAGGADAVQAIQQLVDIRLDEVDQAIRNVAENSPRPEVRAAAAEAILARGDRKGAPFIIRGLGKADAATRERINSVLRSMAQGRPVPLDSADTVADWWRRNFPGDF
jgi:hypothetical protein